ncbi:MAG: hypothetical protein JSS22_16540 [Proteobacteria bacterium]|nr:hypothetical protein [Pseudomonadota bacterium]
MQLIASRTYPRPDGTPPQEPCAREVLFRGPNGDFILYVAARGGTANAEERVLRLDTRNALIWINEDAECARPNGTDAS